MYQLPKSMGQPCHSDDENTQAFLSSFMDHLNWENATQGHSKHMVYRCYS